MKIVFFRSNPIRIPVMKLSQLILTAIALFVLGSSVQSQCGGASYQYGHVGFYDDGSGNNDYGNYANCSWQFQSGIGGVVRLGFYEFSTESNYDFVRIYDGPDASYTLLAELSGNDVVGDIYYTTGEYAYVEWSSDGSQTAPGFYAWWDSYNSTREDCEGDIWDGYYDYDDGVTYHWLIEPEGAEQITLDITSLATESCCDFIKVYDGTSTGGALIGSYSGSSPVYGLVAESGAMYIEFSSDGSITDAGFSANYYCSYCGGQVDLTAESGTFDDGSGVNQYGNNTDCSWYISSAWSGLN